MKIDRTVALVTGGSRGIGKACVDKLLSLGAKVCFTGLSEENGGETLHEMKIKYGEGKALFCQCDVTDYKGMENVFMLTEKTFGKLDIIINNAGIMDELEWERSLNANVIGSYGVIVLAMKYLGTSNGKQGGVVINMGSALGVLPAFFSPAYSASKYAMVGMTRSYGSPEHLAENGVRVNALSPWLVQTEMSVGGGNHPLLPEKAKEAYNAFKRLKTITPQTVAEKTVQLIEDESKNGEVVLLDHDLETKVVTFQEFFPTSSRQ